MVLWLSESVWHLGMWCQGALKSNGQYCHPLIKTGESWSFNISVNDKKKGNLKPPTLPHRAPNPCLERSPRILLVFLGLKSWSSFLGINISVTDEQFWRASDLPPLPPLPVLSILQIKDWYCADTLGMRCVQHSVDHTERIDIVIDIVLIYCDDIVLLHHEWYSADWYAVTEQCWCITMILC